MECGRREGLGSRSSAQWRGHTQTYIHSFKSAFIELRPGDTKVNKIKYGLFSQGANSPAWEIDRSLQIVLNYNYLL